MGNFEHLLVPFAHDHLEFKVEVKSKDGKKGQASTYVDPRRYMERLDEAFGPANWSVEYKAIGDQAVIARLSITHNGQTVVREDVGEFGVGGRSQFPTATAQAFKRACASLGLGRYLYFLPKMWGLINDYGQFEPSEIEKFKKMVPAPSSKATPAPVKQQEASVSPQRQKMIARIKTLLAEADDLGIDFNYLSDDWELGSESALTDLGKQISADLQKLKG
jgi:hypothetical protein